ncbi:MAG TPA: hypothetical protein VLB68_28295, partial [Pyrinomonadaceae bacterium]|nr:hypothetical protein [Pyrinomonadaceae bacterium]
VQRVLQRGIGNATGQARLIPIIADTRHPNPNVAILAQAMAPNTLRTDKTSDEEPKFTKTF